MKSFLNILILGLSTLFVSSLIAPDSFTPLETFGAVGTVLFGLSFLMPSGVAFMAIPLQDSRNLFTKKLIAVYKEKVDVMSFLRSFFTRVETMTKEISIEVQRGTEKIAVDVKRGTAGNRNTFSKSTEKVIEPPFYWEYMSANEHRLYDTAIGSEGSAPAFAQLTAELAEDLFELQKKIERAVEKQCADVLMTGVITLSDGSTIDYKRKAASIVAYAAGNDFGTAIDPFAVFKAAAVFLRKTGKVQTHVFDAILGDTVITDLFNNAIFKERQNLFHMSLDTINTPRANAVGGVYHGTITAGPYRVNLWTYPDYYEDSTGTMQPYIADTKMVVLPPNPGFKLVYAAVPQLIGQGGSIPQQGAFLIQDFIDERATTHEYHIKACPIAVPTKVDQMITYTISN